MMEEAGDRGTGKIHYDQFLKIMQREVSENFNAIIERAEKSGFEKVSERIVDVPVPVRSPGSTTLIENHHSLRLWLSMRSDRSSQVRERNTM
jgi:hypothetical protein